MFCFLAGCTSMRASVPQETANIGGMEPTPNNPIEGQPTPMENASKMISY